MKCLGDLLTIVLICLGWSVHSQVTDGLFAEYLFNDGTANATVGGIDGTINNAYPAIDRFGCPDRAMEFVPADESTISFGDSFDEYMAVADSSFSISIWFKVRSTAPDDHLMLTKYAHSFCGEEERQIVLRRYSDGVIGFLYYTSLPWGQMRWIQGSTAVLDTNWHHIVINYDGSDDSGGGLNRVEMYLDNAPETVSVAATYGSLGDLNNGTAHLGLGNAINSSGGLCEDGSPARWDGYLDDLKFFNRELEAFEVDLLYNAPNACCDINDSISVDPGVITVYQLGATYQWIDCHTGLPIDGEVNQFLFPESSGSYACIINIDGCSDTTDCVEYVDDLGFNEHDLIEVFIHPNPTNGHVSIQTEMNQYELNVTDIRGQIVLRKKVHSSDAELDLFYLENGVYFLNFLTENGTQTERLIINH